MSNTASHRFAVAKDRVHRERQQLLAMSNKIRIKSVSSDRIRAEIMRVVCEVFGVTPEQVKSRTRLKQITYARHAYCHLASSVDPMSTLQSIGKTIGRDHSTVINSINKCNNLRETDIAYAGMFQRCIEELSESTDESLRHLHVEQIQQRNSQRQREMQRALHAIDIVNKFMAIWDSQILSDGFAKDPKAIVAAFNDLRTEATHQGF